jgi:hypothetical protein
MLGNALGVSRERIRQIQMAAELRFQRHWGILVDLAERAGVRVDWDWLLGRSDVNRYECD